MLPTRQDSTADRSLLCARCAVRLLPGSGDLYRITVEAVADPFPPNISEEDLTGDIRQKIKQLITRMENLSEQEALDQVYHRLTFYLCCPCYRRWIENPAGGQGVGNC